MRKWRGTRPRRGREQDGSNAGQEPAPVESLDPGSSETPAEPAGSPEVADAFVAADADHPVAAPARNRSRGRRRKKKPAAEKPAVAEKAAPPLPLIPAYTETEGPRAPLPIAPVPGAPTGEAAELELPVAPPAAPQPQPVLAPPPPGKRPAKGAVVLSVGLPGSGKTTWFKRKGVTPLSSDLLRTLLFDDPTQQGHQDLVFSSLRYLLRARLMARMPMNYVDATNLSPKERRHWVRLAREFGYEMHAVYFDVPLNTCVERNQKRQRVVPEEVMERMAAKLRPPTFEEGFTKIVVVRVKHRPGEAAVEAPGPEPRLAAPVPSDEAAGKAAVPEPLAEADSGRWEPEALEPPDAPPEPEEDEE